MALARGEYSQYLTQMRSLAHHVREWRTPIAVGVAVLLLLIALGSIDMTAARTTGAVTLIAVLSKLLFSRKL